MVLIHDADHLRQARNWCYTIPERLWLINLAVYLPSVIALVLTLAKRPRAAGVATMTAGAFVALSFSWVHLFGTRSTVWGRWSRPFMELGADAISWMVLAATVAVGAWVAVVGGRAVAGDYQQRPS